MMSLHSTFHEISDTASSQPGAQPFFAIMSHSFALLLTALLLLISAQPAQADDFGLLDQHGNFHQLSRYGNDKLVMIMPISMNQPDSLANAHDMQALATEMADQGIIGLFMESDAAALESVETRSETIAEWADAQGLTLPVLIDGSQTAAATLEVESLGEIIGMDPDGLSAYFRGQWDEAFVRTAIGDILAERPVRPSFADPAGPTLTYHYQATFAENGISYANDIAPLLMQRCAFCHIENGLAPWAMNRHLMVMGWSPMMRETLVTKRMPPGQIDGQVGNWQTSHELSDEELAMLVTWIDQRAPREGDADPLAEPREEPPIWEAGEPDLVVDLPPQQIPATGTVDFMVERIPLSLDQDRWLSGIAYHVGEKSVLHSVLVYAIDKDNPTTDPVELISADNADYFSVFVPGETVDPFAPDTGFLLKADQDLVVKLRYLTSGREELDKTQLGLYFHDTPPARRLRTITLQDEELAIPANVANHKVVMRSEPLGEDVRLESYSPHAHSRGMQMRVFLETPDASDEDELLINVANFNFNWQLDYRQANENWLPAGSRLRAETVYDNSEANPYNADPDQALSHTYSDQGEMFSHFIRISEAMPD
jgi:hypothetical protein